MASPTIRGRPFAAVLGVSAEDIRVKDSPD
jgi:hypothetical protein